MRYACQKCGAHYKWYKTLKRHITFECGQAKHYQCTFCSKFFKRADNLRIHIKKIHKL